MKNIIALCSCLLLLLASCDGWLEQNPENTLNTEQAFSTVDDLNAALTGVYHLVKGEDLAGRNWLLFSDLMGGNVSLISSDFTEMSALNISIFNSRVEGLWISSYRAINQLNLVLAAIDPIAAKDPVFSPTDQAQLRGEALFLRGLLYDYLLRYFALPPGPQTRDSLGVPLVLEAVQNQGDLAFPTRATVREVFDQVQSDLQKAQELLPLHSNPGRVNAYAAMAYLARLTCQQEKWLEAAVLCQAIIDGSYNLTTTPQGFFRQEGSTEEIWVAKAAPDNPNLAGLNWAYSEARINSDLIDMVFPSLLLPLQLTALEQNGYEAVDLRLDTGRLTTDPLLSTDQLFSNKYEDRTDLGDDAPLLRLAEILLIRAEALAQLGETAEALEQLNIVRRRAFRILDSNGSLLPGNATGSWVDIQDGVLSTEELLDAIARERQVELAFEGHLLHDRIRRREDVRPGVPWNDPRLRLPIPQREMDANPNLVQNPGY